jgi:WD40 repeat protein
MADAVAVTPNKRVIIAGADHIVDRPGYIKFWDFKTEAFIRSDPWSHYELNSLLAPQDNRSVIVSGRDDHTLRDGTYYILVGDIETGEYRTVKEGHDFSRSLSFTWDKKYVLFGEYIWDWRMGGEPRPKRNTDPLLETLGRIVLTAKHVLASTDEAFIVEDFQTGQIVQKFSTGHNNELHRYAPKKVTPNGRYLLSQKGNHLARNEILAMWDIYTGKFVKTFESCLGTIKSIDITADGQHAVILAYDPNSVIRVLDLQTGELILSIDPDQ